MIDGSLIRLRVWREDDLQILSEMRNDIYLQAQLLSRVRGSNADQVLAWLQDRADRLFFVIADANSDAAIGYLQISNLNTLDRHGDLGICLAGWARGRGLGTEAVDLVSDYLRNTWGLSKINLRVRADNIAAQRCYEKSGFKRCGLLRNHICLEQQWLDVVLMERFLTGGFV